MLSMNGHISVREIRFTPAFGEYWTPGVSSSLLP
jgi:hypothetical protein